MADGEVHSICCCLTWYSGELDGLAAEEGAAPGGGHGRPPRGRARRLSRGRPGWEPWGTAGGAQEAGGAPAARVRAAEDSLESQTLIS